MTKRRKHRRRAYRLGRIAALEARINYFNAMHNETIKARDAARAEAADDERLLELMNGQIHELEHACWKKDAEIKRLKSFHQNDDAPLQSITSALKAALEVIEQFALSTNWTTVPGAGRTGTDFACAWIGPKGPYSPDAYAREALARIDRALEVK